MISRIRFYFGASLNYAAMKLLRFSDHLLGSKTVIVPDGYYLVKTITEVEQC